MGYNPLTEVLFFQTERFTAPQESCHSNPATNLYAMLPFACWCRNIVNLGCVNSSGLGYYCLDASGALYYIM